MNDSVILTFVIPCYNVEKYVSQCLDSIIACESVQNRVEILCVDDCSPDNTSNVLQSYSERHSNIRIISHIVNMGLGGARNTGIREARGRYLWFVDSDDYIECDKLFEIISMLSSNNIDVFAFNYREINDRDGSCTDQIVFGRTEELSGLSFVKSVFGQTFVNHAGYVWRFVYSTAYLRNHQLFFPEHVYWEDTVYMPKSILSAERIMSIPDICYNYRRNSDSVSGIYHQSYPGTLIAQMSFGAGGELLSYSSCIEDEVLAETFRNRALSMINSFPVYLLRTCKKQREEFYRVYNNYCTSEVWHALKYGSKLFLTPIVGKIILPCVSPIYRLKRKINHRV